MKTSIFDYVNNFILERLGKIKNKFNHYLIDHNFNPINPLSKTNYQGINLFILQIVQISNNYESNCYATYKQITEAGGTVRRGEKGTKILFFSYAYFFKNKKIDKEAFEQLANKKINGLRKTPIFRYYIVFNFDQCDDLIFKPSNLRSHTPISAAEKIIVNSKAIIQFQQCKMACYIPALDVIQTPRPEYYTSESIYYSTLFHELSHWSGHHSRLNRVLSQKRKEYAFEELVAELTAAYLATSVNLQDVLPCNTAYIDSWIQVLQNDKKFFFAATAKAQQAFHFLKISENY